LAVNNTTSENSSSVWVQLRGSKASDWTEHLPRLKLVAVLLLGVPECNLRHLHFWGSNSFSRNASGQHT